MAGRGILNGWVPYVDFFDLKGPYFFFLEALGQFFFYSRTGAFFIQIFAFYFALILILKICLLFIDFKKTLFVLSIFTISHIATLWGGNTLEEYVLPLSLLCLYLTAKNYVESGEYKIKWYTPFICGISFSIMLFSKVSVSAPIVGIVLASIIIYIIKKDYKSLLLYLFYGILGIIAGALPVILYFSLHNSISDMIYCVFIVGFKRSIDYGQKIDLKWELKISGCYFALIFSLLQLLKLKDKSDDTVKHIDMHVLILCMSIITAISLHLGTPYIYYFTTAYPAMLFALIILLNIHNPMILFKTWRIDIPLIVFAVFMGYIVSWTGDTLSTVIYNRDAEFYGKYVNDALEMGAFIPESDRDSVFSFNMDMQWFEINHILPCYKYQINLPYFASIEPGIETEILEFLKTTPPKWLVVGDDLDTSLPEVDEYILDNYQNIYNNDYGALYLIR